MRDVTLAGLRVVLEAAQQGSFTAAAEVLGYTQSAISRQIAVTEAAVGSVLFERGARGVELTPVGEVLVRHARHVLGQLTAAESEIAGLRDRVVGRLVVGAFPVAAAQVVPQAIALARSRHPALVVDLREAGSPTQLRMLRAGRVDVAVVARGEGLPQYDLRGLRVEVLASSGLGVAMSTRHPLAARREVTVADLSGEPWVVGSGAEPQFGVWPTLSDANIGYRVHSWQTRLGIVAAGLAVAVVPASAAGMLPRGVTWVAVDDPDLRLDRESVVLTAPDRSLAARSFVRALHEVVADPGSS